MIGGLSMGGFGAIKLALKHPEMFCAAASHSGALWRPSDLDGYRGSELHRVFGDSPAGGPDDIFALAERVARDGRPALRIDCGTEDCLLPPSRAFHAHLERLGVAHEYAEFPVDTTGHTGIGTCKRRSRFSPVRWGWHWLNNQPHRVRPRR